jgi:diguanylate cyclase (GGDEF)-like protein
MQKDWSSFQVSFLLYMLVVLFPVNLYFANALTSDTESDTDTIAKIVTVSSDIKGLLITSDTKKVDDIDRTLSQIKRDFIDQDANQFTVSFESAQNVYSEFARNWGDLKAALKKGAGNSELTIKAQKSWESADKLGKIAAKIADMKRENGLNALYLSLVFTMVVTVAMIYFVRTYMKIQLDKHTIYDLTTKLFNADYFRAQLPQMLSIADRHAHDLSIVMLSIDNIEAIENDVGTSNLGRVLEVFGGLLVTLTRGSDVACRTDYDQFAIITPETNIDQAKIVAERIHSQVMAHNFDLDHPLTVSIAIARALVNESGDKLIARCAKTLKEAEKSGNKTLVSDAVKKA